MWGGGNGYLCTLLYLTDGVNFSEYKGTKEFAPIKLILRDFLPSSLPSILPSKKVSLRSKARFVLRHHHSENCQWVT